MANWNKFEQLMNNDDWSDKGYSSDAEKQKILVSEGNCEDDRSNTKMENLQGLDNFFTF